MNQNGVNDMSETVENIATQQDAFRPLPLHLVVEQSASDLGRIRGPKMLQFRAHIVDLLNCRDQNGVLHGVRRVKERTPLTATECVRIRMTMVSPPMPEHDGCTLIPVFTLESSRCSRSADYWLEYVAAEMTAHAEVQEQTRFAMSEIDKIHPAPPKSEPRVVHVGPDVSPSTVWTCVNAALGTGKIIIQGALDVENAMRVRLKNVSNHVVTFGIVDRFVTLAAGESVVIQRQEAPPYMWTPDQLERMYLRTDERSQGYYEQMAGWMDRHWTNKLPKAANSTLKNQRRCAKKRQIRRVNGFNVTFVGGRRVSHLFRFEALEYREAAKLPSETGFPWAPMSRPDAEAGDYFRCRFGEATTLGGETCLVQVDRVGTEATGIQVTILARLIHTAGAANEFVWERLREPLSVPLTWAGWAKGSWRCEPPSSLFRPAINNSKMLGARDANHLFSYPESEETY